MTNHTCSVRLKKTRGCARLRYGNSDLSLFLDLDHIIYCTATRSSSSSSSSLLMMSESKKRKRVDDNEADAYDEDVNIPRITYHAIGKSFDRLFKGEYPSPASYQYKYWRNQLN